MKFENQFKVCGFVLGLALGSLSSVMAQQSSEPKYLLTSQTNQYGWSIMDLTDAYLSELPYSGFGLQFNSTFRRFLNLRNEKVSMRTDLNIHTGLVMNQPQSASITYFGGNLGYGLQAHLKPLRNLHLLIGGIWDAELGIKSYSREVNNSWNVDLATNLNLATTVRYDLTVLKRQIRLQADLRSPLLGLMFVPERGASYSEIFYLHSYDNLLHLTSLHNKNGLNIRYLVQIPLKNSVLNLGFQTDYLKYAANDMIFRRNITSMSVGVTYDLVMFGGRKNAAPSRFISSEW